MPSVKTASDKKQEEVRSLESNWVFNRPSPYGDRRFIKWTGFVCLFVCFFFLFASFGLTYEQRSVKLVVWVLKSGTFLYKTHAHISLLNVTFVRSCLLIYSI